MSSSNFAAVFFFWNLLKSEVLCDIQGREVFLFCHKVPQDLSKTLNAGHHGNAGCAWTANLLCKSLDSWGHGFGWMIAILHCAWRLWVVSWRSTCFSDHIWISCPGGSYDVASEEPKKGADGWPGFPEVFLGDCWRSMVALSVGWACFCLAWRCNPWRSQEFMKWCILVFSHIMPFEYRKHEYFRCPCKPTQNRNFVKLEFFSPLWNQESSGSFGITWSLRSLTGGLLNGCAKPSSQNSHVGTSNQWVHGTQLFFLKGNCSWIYFQSQLLLCKIFLPFWSSVTSHFRLANCESLSTAKGLRKSKEQRYSNTIKAFFLFTCMVCFFPWQNYCFLSFNYHVC